MVTSNPSVLRLETRVELTVAEAVALIEFVDEITTASEGAGLVRKWSNVYRGLLAPALGYHGARFPDAENT